MLLLQLKAMVPVGVSMESADLLFRKVMRQSEDRKKTSTILEISWKDGEASKVSALADTGSSQNVISRPFVQKLGLSIKEDQGRFKTSAPLDSVWKDREVSKIKRGLPGFVNGSRTSALADTGAAQNIVSAAFVQEKGLSIKKDQGRFRLGNSKIAQSVGKTHSDVHVD